ncbi:MAG: hypothetical protein HYZ14_04760 [Bacteroidetes bacterium]|nr:hypothetical protein [Bacteroidota bacterium]
MKTKYITGVALCFFFATVTAQENATTEGMGGGGFTIGYGNMGVRDLNTFVPASVPFFSNNQMLLGGTGHGVIGRLVIGGSGCAISGDRFATDSLRGSISGGQGTFDVGYILINKNKLKFFPMLGVGGGGYGISISKNIPLSATTVSLDPGQEINISQGGIVTDISLNLYTIPALAYDKEENSYGGFMIGLQVGYLFSVPNSLWGYSGGDITGGPSFGLNMPYAKLVLGGFGFSKTTN